MKPRNELSAEEAAILLGKKKPSDDHEMHVKLHAEARGSKFHNRKTTLQTFFGEHTFDSKKEATRYQELSALMAIDQIAFFLCQVPFRLPGKTKYVADFLVVGKDGGVTVEDVKGMKTAMYQLKKRQVEEIYRIQIEEL